MTEDKARKTAVCVDGSNSSIAALRFYAEHLHRSNAEVLVLHIPEQLKISAIVAGGGIGYMPDGLHVAIAELNRKNQQLSEQYEKLCQELGLDYTVHIPEDAHNDVGASIIDSVKKNECNLIIVGSRGLGTVRKTFLGSVSDYLVHHAHIPVLVCPPPPAK